MNSTMPLTQHRKKSGVTALRAVILGALALCAAPWLASPLAAQPGASVPPRALSLEEALAIASGTSEGIGLAQAGVERARGQQLQARSAILPQVNASFNYQRQLQNQFQAITERFARSDSGGSGGSSGDGGDDIASNPITRIFASPYTVTATLQATQPIFTGGRARAGINAAQFGRQSSDLGVTSAQAQVQLQVTEAYYNAVLGERLVAIAESSLVQSERTARQVQLTFDVGNTSEFELIRARVTRDNQRPQYLQARTQSELARLRLKQLLDLPLDQPLNLTSPIQEAPASVASTTPGSTSLNVSRDEVIADDPRVRDAMNAVLMNADTLVDQRLPVRQASLNVSAAQEQLKSTRASRWPQISVSTLYQRFAYPDNGLPVSLNDFFPNWSVSLGASLPLFTGGRVKGEILAAEAGVQEARLRLQQTREAAEYDVQQAITQFEQSQAAWLASVGTAEQAQRGFDIAEVRYSEGISTQIELSETRVQLQQALANRAQAARDLQVARVRIALLRDLPLSQAVAGGVTQGSQAGAQTTARPNQTAGAPGGFTQPGAPSGGNTP